MAVSNRQQLIVGVDFGTTYTGLAYAYSGNTDHSSIELVQTWPGKAGGLDNKKFDKVPTEISFEGATTRWGYQLSAGASRYGCFKLLLDGKTRVTAFDDARLKVDPGNPNATYALPAGMTALSISEKYLECLYKHCMEMLERRMLETFYLTPIHFIITTPAVWSHAAQTSTRAAAFKAGFGSRVGDTVSMISEPEAAANFCLREINAKESIEGSNVFQIGQEFLICDAGGGTVDLITYTVKSVFPKLEIKEAVVGNGGKCGSTTVDRAFLRLLRERIGPKFDKWPAKKTGRGSSLMSKFEEAKRDFGTHDEDSVWRIPLGNVEDDEIAGIQDGELLLLPCDMEDLFSDAISKIMQLLNDQLTRSRVATGRNVKSILLVGGFGQSEYLYQELNSIYEPQGIKVVASASSWSAVAKGAVIAGHHSMVTSRRLKYNYGIALSVPFIEGVHNERDAFIDIFDEEKYASGYMAWFAAKSDEVEVGQRFPINFSHNFSDGIKDAEIVLYGCSLDDAPDRRDSKDVFPIGKVRINYRGIPAKYFLSKQVGKKTIYMAGNQVIQMEVGSGEIKFVHFCDRKTFGSTTLELE